MQDNAANIPRRVSAIGYTHAPKGMPLEAFDKEVPEPAPDEILIRAVSSSLNPLDYKLADLNFMNRTPPVALGFDFAGTVVGRGRDVTAFDVGDEVYGMVPSNRDGVWTAGGAGGYASVPTYMTARRPAGLSVVEAGVLGVCYLSVYLAFDGCDLAGASVYIPGGGGGVGHLAIQKARALGAKLIISSGGNERSRALAKSSGAHHVFNYKEDDVAAEIARLTAGQGVDLVFDATYSEESFVVTARMVRRGGRWVVLGVGPGKTTRKVETQSPVASILAAKDAKLDYVNLLRFFAGPESLTDAVKALLSRAIGDVALADGHVKPRVTSSIASTPDAINASLADMMAGRAALGKIAVTLDTRGAGSARSG